MTNPSADDARPANAGRAPAPSPASPHRPTGHRSPGPPSPAPPLTRNRSAPGRRRRGSCRRDRRRPGRDRRGPGRNRRRGGRDGRRPSRAAFAQAPATAGATATSRCCGCVGIGKNFGPVRALTDIDLDIPAGQVTALVGDNGAGKSHADQDDRGDLGAGPRRDPLAGQAGPLPLPQGRHGPRDRHRLPGPGAVPTTSTSCRTCSSATSRSGTGLLDEITMEKTAKKHPGRPARDHRPQDPPAGRLAVRRPAPGRRGGQGRACATPSW